MSYSVKSISKFEKSLKKLVKKYPSLKSEYITLVNSLKDRPKQGTPLGKNCYKIRLSIGSKGKGKSGGARVLTHFYIDNETVYLLSIYDKSETESLSNHEIEMLLASIQD